MEILYQNAENLDLLLIYKLLLFKCVFVILFIIFVSLINKNMLQSLINNNLVSLVIHFKVV